MIQDNNKSEAKAILKKALDYLDSTDPDPTMLAIALNNLCVLTIEGHKFYKALHYVLNAMQIMEIHIS